jgi:hypothetical protein
MASFRLSAFLALCLSALRVLAALGSGMTLASIPSTVKVSNNTPTNHPAAY